MAVLGSINTAFADDLIKVPGVTTTGNVAITTDYRFRGVSQSSNNPAIQGGMNFNHESGAYFSVWGSSIDSSIGGGASAEMDLMLGYTTKLDLSASTKPTLDVGVMRYGYFGSGDSVGGKQPDFTEVYGKLTFADALTKGDAITTGLAYSPEYFGHTNDFWYVSAGYSAPIGDTGFGFVGSVGYNKFKNEDSMAIAAGGDGSDDSYIDYKAGVTFGFQGLTAELDVIGTDISTDGFSDGAEKPLKPGAVFSLTKTF